MKNWRPISLLCVDYKIGTRALAARLQKVLPSVLHQDQTCGVPGRSIFSNLYLVRDLTEYCTAKNLPLAIISLDQEKAFDRVKDFVDSVSLCDVFRVKFPRRKLFTRHNKTNTNMLRIDRIYAPKSTISDALGYTFDPCSYSDHDLVSVKFNCKQTLTRGPGLWKFNSNLTQDDDYTGLMIQFLQDWKLQKERYPDLRTWWDIGKSHIRTITVEFVTAKRREKRSLRSNLVCQLCRAEQEPVPSAGLITDLRRQIRETDEEFISGVIVRSKELWVKQGEKPTKYFFNLEKKRQQKKEMTELISSSGVLLSNSADIENEMNNFYKNLFSEEEVDLEAQDWLLDPLSMSLDEQEQASCEGLLTVEECREALNGNLPVFMASRLNSI